MEKAGGKKIAESAKDIGGGKVPKHFVRLPSNYEDMTDAERKEWMQRIAQRILRNVRK